MRSVTRQYKLKIQVTRGFSLIELILIIVIIGIVAITVVPKSMGTINGLRLRNAANKLKDDIRYIQNFAVARHDTSWLVMDPLSNSYGIYSGPSVSERELILDPFTNRQAVINLEDMYNSVYISSVNFSGNTEMYFNWWGKPSNGGEIILNDELIISIVPGTGYVFEGY